LASRRLLGCIEADATADRNIRCAQVFSIVHYLHVFDDIRLDYAPYFDDYTNVNDMVDLHINDPHEKKELRIRARDEAILNGVYADTTGPWVRPNKIKCVEAKLKKMEKAKYVQDPAKGKLPRMIFDIGVLGSLIGAELLSRLKSAMAEETILYKGARIRFIKSPNPFVLATVFRELYETEYDLDFICFSDDAGFAMKIDGKIRWFLSDISSADASYTPALFALLKRVLPEHTHAVVDRLIDQCKLPFKMRSCVNRKIYVLLKPIMPVLYTGSTLTTAINTFANFIIALSLADNIGSVRNADDIIALVRRTGFVVTVSECSVFEKFQFLKHSPVRDIQGKWQPLLNFGVLMRASGMCMGDLPGRGDWKQRALAFQRGLLRGAYPYASFRLLDAMWAAVGKGSFTTSKTFDHKVTNDKYPPFRVDDDSFCARYDLHDAEFSYLAELLGQHSYGFSINTSAIHKITVADYDLPTVNYQYPLYHHIAATA